jgi:glyceraldehyde 3-phosphate dehydrogenase (phosphorylating)
VLGAGTPSDYTLEGNFLVNSRFRSRVMPIDGPEEMPGDIFGVVMVIDSTGKYRSGAAMQAHLRNGARRTDIARAGD